MVVDFLLENVPTVWLGIGIVLIAVTVSLLGLALVRRHVDESRLRVDQDVAGFLIAVVGVIYAVLLGFVVVIVWEQFDNTDTVVANEAAAVGSLYRDGVALGGEGRALQVAVARYANSIVNVEWPYMAKHETESAQTDAALNEVYHAVTKLRARDNTADADFVTNAVEDLSTASEDRRERIRAASSEIPTPLWVVLIVGGMVSIGFTYLFGVTHFTTHALMVSMLATIIALSLLVILTLNLPFTGDVSLKPDAMRGEIAEFAGYHY